MPANVTLLNPLGFLTPIGPREINEIPLDVVIEEQVIHTVAVTDHPIEVPSVAGPLRGSVSDNAYLEPSTYTMRGAVSDFPISWRLFDNRYANATGETRSISAYQLLLTHFREVIPFTLLTPLGEMENMLFTAFRVPRNQQSKHAVIFFAEFREILVVVTDPVDSEVEAGDVEGEQAETGAVSEQAQGDTAGAEVQSGSVLSRGLGAVVDLLGGS